MKRRVSLYEVQNALLGASAVLATTSRIMRAYSDSPIWKRHAKEMMNASKLAKEWASEAGPGDFK